MRTRRQQLGQHFLNDARVAHEIAASVPADPPKVIEIGPGLGALTRHLIERFEHVRAVELDARLAASLAARLGRPANLEVVRDDAVTADLDAIAAGARWSVVGNLPYSVATPIIRRLLPRHDLFSCLVVMVQLEVALRLSAPPGDAERGLLSVEREALADASVLFRVPPRAFSPPPRVVSAVIRLSLRPPRVTATILRRALALAAEAFSHRRKTLRNALAAATDPTVLATTAEKGGIDLGSRPQELSLDDWVALAGAVAPDDREAR